MVSTLGFNDGVVDAIKRYNSNARGLTQPIILVNLQDYIEAQVPSNLLGRGDVSPASGASHPKWNSEDVFTIPEKVNLTPLASFTPH